MPIRVNYAEAPKNCRDLNRFLDREHFVYGRNELSFSGVPGEVSSEWEFNEKGFAVAKRHFSFNLSKQIEKADDARQRGKKLHEVHRWCSENIEGPWMFYDSIGNKRGSYKCKIHFERFDQREEFNKRYRLLSSKINMDPEREIEELGIIKKVIPPFSEFEDYPTWLEEHRKGYEEGKIDIGETTYFFIKPECEEVDRSVSRLFVEAGLMVRNDQEGPHEGAYICSLEDFEKHKKAISDQQTLILPAFVTQPSTMLHQHKALVLPGSCISFRSQKHEETFLEHWGDARFTYDGKRKYYECTEKNYPQRPEREKPQALVDWLYGRGPDPSLSISKVAGLKIEG